MSSSSSSTGQQKHKQTRSKSLYPHHESRVGEEYQAYVGPFEYTPYYVEAPEWQQSHTQGQQKIMFAVCADQKDYHDSPEPMMRCLTAAPGRGFPRAAPTEITGIPMWTPGILPDAVVTNYLHQARKATSPFSDFDQEFVLTLLANNGYDVDQALSLYKHIQNSISTKFVTAAGIESSAPTSTPESSTSIEADVTNDNSNGNYNNDDENKATKPDHEREKEDVELEGATQGTGEEKEEKEKEKEKEEEEPPTKQQKTEP